MFNRKPILAGAPCLHGRCTHEFPSRCLCTKTHYSYSFWKLQASNLEHRLLIPCRSHGNCILGARIEYAFILAIIRAWSFNNNKKWPVGFSLDFLLKYLLCYVLLHYFNISTNCFLPDSTNYMHILASGPEQQSVYFGHVIQVEIEKRRGLALRKCISHSELTH